MLRWLNSSKPPDLQVAAKIADADGNVTDDPLAAIETNNRSQKKIYSVSRSVLLPRVSIKNCTVTAASTCSGRGINPLFVDINDNTIKTPSPFHPQSPPSRAKSSSSGYGGSCHDPIYQEHLKLTEDLGLILEQNPAFVKSIRLAAARGGVKIHPTTVPSQSISSGGGTLSTIPEGKVEQPAPPKPIWPLRFIEQYDSLVDDALLLYTSLSCKPDDGRQYIDISIKELLLELLNSINDTLEGKNGTAAEDMLRIVDEKIRLKLEALRATTEEEMRRLCLNLSSCRRKNSVLRALSNSSCSGASRVRTISSEMEDIYQTPSGASSSEFSDSLKELHHDESRGVSGLVSNMMSHGALGSSKVGLNEALLRRTKKFATVSKKSGSLLAVIDDKPSVWEQYYGVRAAEEGEAKYVTKPTDVPLFPGGRPEADFTLDVPRSEHLLRRMKEDKKWRCRCRLLTSFLGVVFFLLSVMAVSLILTRGKRMFGSMV